MTFLIFLSLSRRVASRHVLLRFMLSSYSAEIYALYIPLELIFITVDQDLINAYTCRV